MSVYQIREYGKLKCAGERGSVSSGEILMPRLSFDSVWDYLLEVQGKDPDSGKAFKLYTRNGRRIIQAQNFAGLIETPDHNVIEILPKIFSGDGELDAASSKEILIRMIATLRDAPYINLQQASLDIRKNYLLLEIFIGGYIAECRRLLLTGLKKGYVSVETNSPFLKGQLKVHKDITVNLINKSRFFIGYKEYNTDIPQNRIIRSTLLKLKNITVSASNRLLLRQLLDAIDHIPASSHVDSDLAASAVSSRLFTGYERVIDWSRIFLKGNSFTPFAGSKVNQAILFPMERLFEDYVAFLFRKHSRHLRINTQHRRFYLVSKHRGNGRFALKPDMYAHSPDDSARCYVMDTKWKVLDENFYSGNYLISQADMYQLYAYGHKYTANGIEPELLLIYPRSDRFTSPLQPFYYETTSGNDHLRLTAVPFDLKKDAAAQIRAIFALLDNVPESVVT